MWIQIVGLVVVAAILYTMRRSWKTESFQGEYIEMNAERMASLHADTARQVRERE